MYFLRRQYFLKKGEGWQVPEKGIRGERYLGWLTGMHTQVITTGPIFVSGPRIIYVISFSWVMTFFGISQANQL